MLQQAFDFRDESDALLALLETIAEKDWEWPTQFKGWTVNDVAVHLHFWNWAAGLSFADDVGFDALFKEIQQAWRPEGLLAFEKVKIPERGRELMAVWRDFLRDRAERWSSLDPKRRVKWAGPDMSVRSSVTARQMETWAHGQEVFDLFGKDREETDRIRNIVILGINTFEWSFRVRGMEAPPDMPFLRLTSPSGQVWTFGEESSASTIEGSAVGFCRVVTQTRNIADTNLKTLGETAGLWMKNAQCFAGPPETPPPPGTRTKVVD